jgi:hypothetical protein
MKIQHSVFGNFDWPLSPVFLANLQHPFDNRYFAKQARQMTALASCKDMRASET